MQQSLHLRHAIQVVCSLETVLQLKPSPHQMLHIQTRLVLNLENWNMLVQNWKLLDQTLPMLPPTMPRYFPNLSFVPPSYCPCKSIKSLVHYVAQMIDVSIEIFLSNIEPQYDQPFQNVRECTLVVHLQTFLDLVLHLLALVFYTVVSRCLPTTLALKRFI